MSEILYRSEWEWQNINRGLDYTVVDGAQLKRNNWTLTRSRYSNYPYESEVDTKSINISAYNGGVPESVSGLTGVSVDGVRFSATTSYTLSSTTWIKTGFYVNGGMTYRQEDSATNSPDDTKTNCLLINTSGSYPNRTYFYGVYELETVDVDSGVFTGVGTCANYITSSDTWAESAWPAGALLIEDNNTTFPTTNAAGTFSPATNNAVASAGVWEATGAFLCTADNQNYQQRGVEWYQQVQVWSFKDAWRTV